MKYRVACWIRVDVEPEADMLFDSPEEAEGDLDQCQMMQPENRYEIEEVEDELERKEY